MLIFEFYLLVISTIIYCKFICYHVRALAGKICVVTGASRGIGKGIALQLGEAGATVYITGNFKQL